MFFMKHAAGFFGKSWRHEARIILLVLGLGLLLPQVVLAGWSPTGSLLTSSEFHTATLLPNGKVMVAGGLGTSSGYEITLSSAEIYYPCIIGALKLVLLD
jgi:hypothetical protein